MAQFACQLHTSRLPALGKLIASFFLFFFKCYIISGSKFLRSLMMHFFVAFGHPWELGVVNHIIHCRLDLRAILLALCTREKPVLLVEIDLSVIAVAEKKWTK
jgi:hypothetical protein